MELISFLRTPPHVVSHKQRIVFSTLAHLLEGVSSQREFQREFMKDNSGKSEHELSVSLRSGMFSSMWSTVSALYFLDKICRTEKALLKSIYLASSVPGFAKTASKLRNARDHISSNIRNLSTAKKMWPVNGLVRWSYELRKEDQDLVAYFQVITIDPMLKACRIPLADGIDQRDLAFGNLALFAFDTCLQVSKAYASLEDFEASLSEKLAIEAKLAEGQFVESTVLSEAEQRPWCFQMEARARLPDQP